MITSLLDTDWYTFTVGQIAFCQFHGTPVRYQLFNRKKVEFPAGFADRLRGIISDFSRLELSNGEAEWLKEQGIFKKEYLNFLLNFRFNPDEVIVEQWGGDISLSIYGEWHQTIFWEVPLLAAMSELFYEMKGIRPLPFEQSLEQKKSALAVNDVTFGETGTRRRFSFAVQQKVVRSLASTPRFLGTSNAMFARAFGLKPLGSMSHQALMVTQGLCGFANSHRRWLDAWILQYEGKFGIILPDTLTTQSFLDTTFNTYYAKLFDGFRHDSGPADEFVAKIAKAYEKVGVPMRDKVIIFSDRMDAQRLIDLHRTHFAECKVVGNIGTNFTNDVGATPLDLVIKVTHAFGRPVVKLSDEPAKATGDARKIEEARAFSCRLSA